MNLQESQIITAGVADCCLSLNCFSPFCGLFCSLLPRQWKQEKLADSRSAESGAFCGIGFVFVYFLFLFLFSLSFEEKLLPILPSIRNATLTCLRVVQIGAACMMKRKHDSRCQDSKAGRCVRVSTLFLWLLRFHLTLVDVQEACFMFLEYTMQQGTTTLDPIWDAKGNHELNCAGTKTRHSCCSKTELTNQLPTDICCVEMTLRLVNECLVTTKEFVNNFLFLFDLSFLLCNIDRSDDTR